PATGRGRVKTLPSSKFGGRLTLGEVERIAPDAIWRLGISSDMTRSAFSHTLGRQQSPLGRRDLRQPFGGLLGAPRSTTPRTPRRTTESPADQAAPDAGAT